MDAIIVGARRQRQGTGPFLAAMLNNAGHRIVGVIGSSLATAETACLALKEKQNIDVPAYKDLTHALSKQAVDIVVIATPYEVHLDLLKQAIAADCHVFCEKPLFWTANNKPLMSQSEINLLTTDITHLFSRRNKVLHLNTQWIYTLSGFMRLYPEVNFSPEYIRSFAMTLSPLSIGTDMLIDSAPHFISLLQACCGPIDVHSLNVRFTSSDQKNLSLQGLCSHQHGETEIALTLRHCPTLPRPAHYIINQKIARRRVKMPEYSISLCSDREEIMIADPMLLSVKDFIAKIKTSRTDNNFLVNSMQCLHQIIAPLK